LFRRRSNYLEQGLESEGRPEFATAEETISKRERPWFDKKRSGVEREKIEKEKQQKTGERKREKLLLEETQSPASKKMFSGKREKKKLGGVQKAKLSKRGKISRGEKWGNDRPGEARKSL